MSDEKKFVPFVPPDSNMLEFTFRALFIGLVMSIILGAANAYLGLRAGMTIAATYPAAVIGMAILKMMKGTMLEENFARTVGSVGEALAAGAIFTLPAFFITGIWKPFLTTGHYLTSTVILITGGIVAILFVALMRRMMVEDKELQFPESVAAAQIHKAGRTATKNSIYLFGGMIIGAVIQVLGQFKLFLTSWSQFVHWFKAIKIPGTPIQGEGGMLLSQPGISPAYVGVGYIIGPKYASLNFSGGVLAWGLLTPIIYYFISPYIGAEFLDAWAQLLTQREAGLTMASALERVGDPGFQISQVWQYIVRPIAIGGMLMGVLATLFKMRKSLGAGLARSISDVKKAAAGKAVDVSRTEKDLKFSIVIAGILAGGVVAFCVTKFVFNTGILPALVAALILIILGFFFSAVSGYLVGIIGSSNNPLSGLTLTALVVTALILVVIGVTGDPGVSTVLGVAAFLCVTAAVAGEMFQDLKVGHILGGTPWKMEAGNIISVVISALVMFVVLNMLNQADIAQGQMEGYTGGFGSKTLAAPQAGLMAILSNGIVSGEMAWVLIIVGLFMGLAFVMMQVKSPMLVAVGMYLPLETTFAIFIGGLIKGVVDIICEKRKYTKPQLARIENLGILIASGLVAGEAITNLGFAPFKIAKVEFFKFFEEPPLLIGYVVLALVAFILIQFPLKNAGKPEEDS
jgi:putative OPT family oligopeptide transporter